MRSVYRTVVVKKELSRRLKLSIYRSISRSTHSSPMVMNFGWLGSLRDRGEKLGHSGGARGRAAAPSHREESAEVAWASVWMPPGRLPREVPRHVPPEEASGRPRTRWRNYVSRLAWERLGFPPEELEEVSGVREVWASLLRLLPPRPRSRTKRMKKMKKKKTFSLWIEQLVKNKGASDYQF
ncbi:hypothetical protein L3Q82_017979 [Scortum barcoo]|uniref:Uncharacterized protein n=1 Tax=Scortum barcoo TaxID=214431 RepID=A0ACB8VHV8_9TELE|nr:hypothetical protein L3Q82_017979 [Scortum barcoo]